MAYPFLNTLNIHEEAYISEIIAEKLGPYPGDGSQEEKSVWVDAKIEQMEKYKEEHPDYKEQAKQHAIENAEKAREEAGKQAK